MSVTGGKNPIISVTGQMSGTTTLYTVPNDKILVITDINVSGYYVGSSRYDVFRLYDATRGRFLWSGYWNLYTPSYPGLNAYSSFTTGIAVAPGTVLQGQCHNCYENIYTITGYLAKP
jgi:hypothetical protein